MIVREVVIPANERVTIPLGYVPQWIMVTINSGVVDFVFGTETETPPITLNAVQTIKLRNYPVRDKCTFIEKVGLEARCYLYLLDAENEADQTGVAVNPLTKTPEGGLIIAGDVTITGKLRVNQSTQLDTTLFIPLKVNVGASGVLESYGGVDVYSSSSTTDVPLLRLRTEGTRTVVASTRTGTGTYVPLVFTVGDIERLRLRTDGVISVPAGGRLEFGSGGRIDLVSGGARRIEEAGNALGGYDVQILNSTASNPGAAVSIVNETAGEKLFTVAMDGSIKYWGAGRQFEFGAGVTKDIDAGKISYTGWGSAGLVIVGAGTAVGNRFVRIWDGLSVGGEWQNDSTITVYGRLSSQGDVSAALWKDSAGNARLLVGLRSDVAGNTSDAVYYTYGGAHRFYTPSRRMSIEADGRVNIERSLAVATANPGGLILYLADDAAFKDPQNGWIELRNIWDTGWGRLKVGDFSVAGFGYIYGRLIDIWRWTNDGEITLNGVSAWYDAISQTFNLPSECTVYISLYVRLRNNVNATTRGNIAIFLDTGQVRALEFTTGYNGAPAHAAIQWVGVLGNGNHTIRAQVQATTAGWETRFTHTDLVVIPMNRWT
jgi:hypothetical protein